MTRSKSPNQPVRRLISIPSNRQDGPDREIIESSTLDKETPIVPLKGDEHANLEKVSSGKNGQTENPPARKGKGQAELVPQTPENSAPASPQLSQGTASQVTDELKLTGEPTEADKFETAKNVIGACFGRKPTSQWKKTSLKELKGYLPSLFEELDDKTRKRLEKRISALPGKYVVGGGVCVVKKAKYHSRNNLDLLEVYLSDTDPEVSEYRSQSPEVVSNNIPEQISRARKYLERKPKNCLNST